MKKILLYTIICLTAFSAVSCKDFLTEKPESLQSANSGFNDEASIKLLMMGAYRSYYNIYTDRRGPDVYGGLGMVGELGGDEVALNPYACGFDLYAYNGDPDDRQHIYRRWYRYHYDAINRATNVIFYAEQIQPTTPGIQSLIAEAKTLRAWSYFRLAQTFGPVPLILEPVEAPVDYATPRKPLKDIYAQIVKDLTEATAEEYMQLQSAGSVEPIRLNHWTAVSMLGKVYLTMASHKESGVVDRNLETIGKKEFGYGAIEQSVGDLYALAQETLGKVVKESGIELCKNPGGYGSLFCADNRNKLSENMWEIQGADGAANSLGLGQGLAFMQGFGALIQGNNPPLLNAGALTEHFFGNATFIIPGEETRGYEVGDRRATWNFTGGLRMKPGEAISKLPYTPKPGQLQNPHIWAIQWNPKHGYLQQNDWNATPRAAVGRVMSGNVFLNKMFRITKFRFAQDAPLDQPTKYTMMLDCPRNFPAMRYADVLLMYAEACLKVSGNNSDTEALWAMNEIRDRARGHYSQQDADYGLIPEGKSVGDVVDPTETPDFPVLTSVDMDDIMAERRWELCFESVRWFDLVRTGRLEKAINENFPMQKGPFAHRTDIDQHDYLFPLPVYEINQSSDKEGFFQNPGY